MRNYSTNDTPCQGKNLQHVLKPYAEDCHSLPHRTRVFFQLIQDAFHKPCYDSEQGANSDGVNPNREISVPECPRAFVFGRIFVQEKMPFFFGGVSCLLDCGEGRDSAFFFAGISARRASVQKGVGRACLSADWTSYRGKKTPAFFAKPRVLCDFSAAVLAKEFRLLFVHHSVPKLFTS